MPATTAFGNDAIAGHLTLCRRRHYRRGSGNFVATSTAFEWSVARRSNENNGGRRARCHLVNRATAGAALAGRRLANTAMTARRQYTANRYSFGTRAENCSRFFGHYYTDATRSLAKSHFHRIKTAAAR